MMLMKQNKEPASHPLGAVGRLGRAALSAVLAISLCPAASFADSDGLSAENAPLTSTDSNTVSDAVSDAEETHNLLMAGSQSTNIEWTTLRATEQIQCSDQALKYYKADEDAHIAIVGTNPEKIKNNYANGLNLANGVTQDVVIPSTITDNSGTVWTVKAIGLGALATKAQTDVRVPNVTIKAALEYVGPEAFRPQAHVNEDNVKVTLAEGGSIEKIAASAFSFVKGEVVYPEGCTVTGDKDSIALTGAGATQAVYPLSHSGSIFNAVENISLYVKSPYASITDSYTYGSLAGSGKSAIYGWADDSNVQSTLRGSSYEESQYSFNPMGVLSSDGWTVPEQYIPEGSESYHCDQNVTFPVVEGATYTFSPKMQLTVSSGDYSWEPTLGDDYTVAYTDTEGNALEGAPTEAGTYKVKFTGNSDKAAQTVWGESDWITYKVDPDISKAELSYDADATAFKYNAKGQAPDIKVTFDGTALTQGNQYQVTYFSADGTASLDKPSAPGSYRALVISLPPATGVVGIVPFTIEPVEIASATATNIAAAETPGTPTVAAYDASGAVIDPDAYTVSYKDSNGNVVEASALATAGSYKAVVAGDAAGCTGSAEAAFTVVDGGKTISSASQAAELKYTGSALTPTLEVKDKNGETVDEANYDVSTSTKPESGEGEVVTEVVAAGNYTATCAAKDDTYVGQATCDFTVAVAEPEASAVTVTLNRSEYDYIPSVYWADESATYTTKQRVIHRGEAIEPDVTVTYNGKRLVEGTDYELECANNTGTDEKFNSKEDVAEATFSVKLKGDYSGELKSDSYKYTIKKRVHSYTYKGIRFAFAIDNDGNAVITGLDMDMDATTTDFSAAYDNAAWDGETFAVPATVAENGKEYAVKRIAGGAFQTPSKPIGDNPTSDTRDILNGSTSLVIEKGIEDIGQRAFSCSKLTSISLPEGLKELHAGCLFGGVVKTTEITIPSTVNAMGHCVFGQNLSNADVAKVTFAQPSQVKCTSEAMESSSGTDEVKHAKQIGAPFDGGAGPKMEGDGSSENYGWAPLTEVTIPASCTGNGGALFQRYGNLVDVYWMAGSFSETATPPASGASGNRGKMVLWGWDLDGTKAIDAVSTTWYSEYYKCYKPFAVLGDGYTYKNALNAETGVCDAEATYPGNVQVGTPVVTNKGDSVSVDWDLQENFVNSKYAWMPVEGEDFTVAYADADGNAVDSIAQPGTYTATLTGNGKTCYGTTTATFTVGAAAIEDSGVELASTSLTYNGAAQEPAVTVKLKDGSLLEAGADYDVSYENNRTVGTGTATVTGKGLYAGSTASAKFAITPATLTVKGEDASKTYGASDPILECTVDGLVGADKAPGYTVERKPGENPGTYAITPTGVFVFDSTGAYATGNYDVKYVNGTFTVKKIQIAVPTGKSLPFTGSKRTGVAKGTGYSLSGATTGTNVGEYTAKATCDATHVFKNGSTTASVKWNITQAANTATAAKTSVTSTQKVANLSKKAGTVALPKVTTKFGTAAWKVSTKDAKGVLTLKSGKVQVKKGAKAGTYTLKLKANVAATKNYKAATTKVVTVKVTVKK